MTTKYQAKIRGLTQYDGSVCKRGHDGRRFVVSSACVQCSTERARARDKQNPKAALARHARANKKYLNTIRGALASKIRRLKHRCANPRYGGVVRVSLTLNQLHKLWLMQEGRCAVSGDSMVLNGNNNDPDSASIDRIRHAGAYTVGNVRLVCAWINSARMNMKDEEFFKRVRVLASTI